MSDERYISNAKLLAGVSLALMLVAGWLFSVIITTLKEHRDEQVVSARESGRQNEQIRDLKERLKRLEECKT